jgi:hypothetical protein
MSRVILDFAFDEGGLPKTRSDTGDNPSMAFRAKSFLSSAMVVECTWRLERGGKRREMN